VELKDVQHVYKLFVDVHRSTKFIMEYQNDFLFNELTIDEGAKKEEKDGDAVMEAKGEGTSSDKADKVETEPMEES
jgi:RuvB-like protein 2